MAFIRSATCFYCQSPVLPPPRNLRLFKCPQCTCWNRYDAMGEIVSDEPAMHDEKLNTSSFAKRALLNKNHLPPAYSKGLFCHTCQTNQTLLVNLLSNYLPPPEDPSYEHRLATLPTYTSSLQARYPPVCADCFPAVEEEIRKKNHMARTQALGGALKESKGKGKERISEQALAKQTLSRELFIWRVRGSLWFFCLLVALSSNAAGAFDLYVSPPLRVFIPITPAMVLVSVAWNFWDPTYSLYRRSKQQGRDIRIDGRQSYIKLQTVSWLSRLITSILLFCSWYRPEWDPLKLNIQDGPFDGLRDIPKRLWFASCFVLELFTLVFSYFAIRIHQPPSVRLVDTSISSPPQSTDTRTHTDTRIHDNFPTLSAASTTPSGPSEPDLFATLSLSPNPIISNYAANPIFGHPSLHTPGLSSSSSSRPQTDSFDDPDAMDWEPATPDGPGGSRGGKGRTAESEMAGDVSLVRPQRFFAPEQPTGLEGLLMRTRLIDDEISTSSPDSREHVRREEVRWNWYWVYALSLIPLIALAVVAWDLRRGYEYI